MSYSKPILPRLQFQSCRNQRGMALIMALVILLILTILGVTAMTTSSLEEKMSGNIQEQTKAFEAAESGISKVLLDANAFSSTISAYTPPAYSFDANKSGTATVTVTYQHTGSASRRFGSSANESTFKAAYFEVKSVGTTVTNAKSTNFQGIEVVLP